MSSLWRKPNGGPLALSIFGIKKTNLNRLLSSSSSSSSSLDINSPQPFETTADAQYGRARDEHNETIRKIQLVLVVVNDNDANGGT